MSIEAMKQALEALESATPKYTRQRADQKTLGGALDYWKLEQHQRLKAITSLRQAIAEAEKQDHWTHHGAGGNVPLPKGTGHLHTCLGMPKAEKQEPVAVIGSGFQLLWCRQDWSKGLKVGDCLYTHPQPKREPPTPLEVKDVLRATGLLTNSQAWDVAEEVMKLLAAHGITSDMKQERVDKTAKQRHEENT